MLFYDIDTRCASHGAIFCVLDWDDSRPLLAIVCCAQDARCARDALAQYPDVLRHSFQEHYYSGLRLQFTMLQTWLVPGVLATCVSSMIVKEVSTTPLWITCTARPGAVRDVSPVCCRLLVALTAHKCGHEDASVRFACACFKAMQLVRCCNRCLQRLQAELLAIQKHNDKPAFAVCT